MAKISSTGNANSTIGLNSYFTGRFFINGSLRVDGKFEGKSLQADLLYIGSSGKVKTNISASTVIVEGMVIGNIMAKTRVMLESTAKVLGDIKTPELFINNGVILEGRCQISNDLKVSAKDLINTEWARDGLTAEKLFGKEKVASR
jgi:cytoskeletal protein CcmA (bactofilin family)